LSRRLSAWTPAAAEFEAYTPYFSTYKTPAEQVGQSQTGPENEVRLPSGKERIMILGGGPNRIGQGIEFDYWCCQAALAVHAAGFETIMVNSNPETVGHDYDTSDHLFFEPSAVKDVLNIVDVMQPKGLIVDFRQTPASTLPALGSSRRHPSSARTLIPSTSRRIANGLANYLTA
jgi:carbamoyl-phosphate synthase large subunit